MRNTFAAPRRLIDRLRYRSHSGRLIRRHRALHRLEFRRSSIVHPLVLLGGSYTALFAGASVIADFWAWQFSFWMPRLELHGAVAARAGVLFDSLAYTVPLPLLDARQPGTGALQISIAACAIAMLCSFLTMRGRLLPFAYLVWGACLVQSMASASFWLAPGAFTHTVGSHVATGLEFALILIFFVPILLSFSFYVFEYSLPKKIAGTVLIVGGVIAVAPYQYLAHTVLIDVCSVAVMPLLYVLFGLLFDIAVFIAIYAWVVSWET